MYGIEIRIKFSWKIQLNLCLRIGEPLAYSSLICFSAPRYVTGSSVGHSSLFNMPIMSLIALGGYNHEVLGVITAAVIKKKLAWKVQIEKGEKQTERTSEDSRPDLNKAIKTHSMYARVMETNHCTWISWLHFVFVYLGHAHEGQFLMCICTDAYSLMLCDSKG